jgi:hypothetical protein
MPLSLKHEEALALIRYFDKICNDNNIWYTLTSGSVLGAVRHNGFIPWDYDIDVFIKPEDLDKMRQILYQNLPAGMKLYVWDKEKNYCSCHDKLAYIDIPHEIVVDLSVLATFEDMLHVSDLKIPANVKVLNDPEEVIALVKPPRSEEELEALDEEVVEDVEKVEAVEGEKAEEGEAEGGEDQGEKKE